MSKDRQSSRTEHLDWIKFSLRQILEEIGELKTQVISLTDSTNDLKNKVFGNNKAIPADENEYVVKLNGNNIHKAFANKEHSKVLTTLLEHDN